MKKNQQYRFTKQYLGLVYYFDAVTEAMSQDGYLYARKSTNESKPKWYQKRRNISYDMRLR